jgi:hypothetical protein
VMRAVFPAAKTAEAGRVVGVGLGSGGMVGFWVDDAFSLVFF